MLRRGIVGLAVLAGLAACSAPPPRPPARPAARTTSASTAPPTLIGSVGLAERVQREAWLTRFWEQLTPSQRRRVLARVRQGDPPMRAGEPQAARVWDGIGLPERNALVFGAGLPRARLEAMLPELTAAGPAERP